jgi:hypothetical protein
LYSSNERNIPNDTSEIERASERIWTIAFVQVLDREEVEASHEVKSQLVQLIVASIGDLLLDARDFEPSTVPATGALLAAGQVPLRMRKFMQALPLATWIGDAFSCGEFRQAIQDQLRHHLPESIF